MTAREVDDARSRNMRAIRSRDTGPGLLLRRGLHARGYRYRVSPGSFVGRPDMELSKWKAADFVHGCVWHAHAGCRFFRLPKTRESFWRDKLAANVARDARTVERLSAEGWRIVVVWECAMRADPQLAVEDVERFLRSKARFLELSGS